LALPLPARLGMVLAAAIPTAVLVGYYAVSLGFSPVGLVWEAALLVAGHAVSLFAVVLWCFVLGCMATATTIIVMAARRPEPAARAAKPAPSVRGPVGYVGPGSLGGTKSAIRR
jgi:hypothetical protein